MAANKFATMLHNRTNKITLVLIYAVLEWILIVLLLLNSLFSYLIIKFADYFGLKRPCLWCSRVDHVLESGKSKNLYRELVCETHASEISKLGYCFNHRKLAESQNMCEDCSSSSQPNGHGVTKKITFMIQNGGEKIIENGEMNLKCSCCDVSLESKYYSPYFLIKPSWGVLDYTQKANLITEAGVDDDIEEGDNSDQSRSNFMIDRCEEEQGIEGNGGNEMLSDVDGGFGRREEEADGEGSCSVSDSGCKEKVANEDDKVDIVIEKRQEPFKEDPLNVSREDPSSDETMIQASDRKDASFQILPQHLEFYIDNDDFRLIPVELIDSTTAENQNEKKLLEEDRRNCDNQEALLAYEVHVETEVELVVEGRCNSGETVAVLSAGESEEEPWVAVLESMEMEETQNSLNLDAEEGDLIKEVYEEVAITQATQSLSEIVDDVQAAGAAADGKMDSDVHLASEEVFQMQTDETDAEISIGTEIPDREPIEEIQTQDALPSSPCIQEDPSTSSAKLHANDDHGPKEVQEEMGECKTISVEMNEQTSSTHLSMCPDLNEIEEEKVPDTPTSIDHLHKKLLLLEKRESGTEESLDGSVISEFEAGEGVLTVERLKLALRTERKALNALYTELEEERSASAVAASQTMAMINRLQEERAAMQMEALQYQRMMEEQSEYDQEALQLLNELMVKREKEKQELEKELEIYRKKVMDYEAKEKMMMLRRRKDGSARSRTSTTSCSNAEDSDGLSIDLNQEGKEEDSFYSHQESGNHNTPVDAVFNLEESLANFEEERISILEQLKVLEEKLFTLADEEERHLEDMKPFEQFYEENGKEFEEHFDLSSEVNGFANGFPKEMNGKHEQERRIMGSKAKRLLPLFDAISAETEDGVTNGNEEGFDSIISQPSSVTKFELESKKVAMEEELDHLYERLQALEADREFLKHCIGSLKKGDKGMDLLQEILQHLRDLRNVELRVRNMGDGALM